ncbi:hypothetical protein VF13_38985 [Nostoc linckia z16]|nr:hypothetical protein VF13_38985 [Nostoc linckia z16]
MKKLTIVLVCFSVGAAIAQQLPNRLQLAVKTAPVHMNFYTPANSYGMAEWSLRFANNTATMKPGDIYISGDKFYYNDYTPAFMKVLQQPQLIVDNPAGFDPSQLFRK